MDITYIFNPVVTPGLVAVIGSIAILTVLLKNTDAIMKSLNLLRARLFTRTGFFWIVNLVFMAVSVLHAGIFFGITGKDDPTRYLGFAVSFFLDLVTIILMQAMLEARYRGEEGRARQFLLFIAVCCGTSTFANLAISLNDYSAATMLPHAPLWVQTAAPYVLASFPLFVIMMSIAAEMIVNIRPLDQLNEDEYEADEKKRLRMLQIRNTYLQMQVDEELKTLTIRAQMKANKLFQKGAATRRYFWQKSVDTEVIIAGVAEQLKAMYEPQIESLKRRLEEMQTQTDNDSFTGFDTDPEMASQVPSMAYECNNRETDEDDFSSEDVAADVSSSLLYLHPKPTQKRDNPATIMKRLMKRNPEITVTELASKAGVSKSTASRFKSNFPATNMQQNDPQNEGA